MADQYIAKIGDYVAVSNGYIVVMEEGPTLVYTANFTDFLSLADWNSSIYSPLTTYKRQAKSGTAMQYELTESYNDGKGIRLRGDTNNVTSSNVQVRRCGFTATNESHTDSSRYTVEFDMKLSWKGNPVHSGTTNTPYITLNIGQRASDETEWCRIGIQQNDAVRDGSKFYLRISNKNSGSWSNVDYPDTTYDVGTTYHFKIEIWEDDSAILIYIDDTLISIEPFPTYPIKFNYLNAYGTQNLSMIQNGITFDFNNVTISKED